MLEEKSDIQKRLEEMTGEKLQFQNPVRVGIANQPISQKPKSRIGCFIFGIPIILFIVIIIFFLGKSFILPTFFTNDISGNLMDYTYVPETDRLWIITDGSFHYISKTTTNNSVSMKSKGLFCKTWTYIFDPVKNVSDSMIKTKYEDLPPTYKLFYNNGKVWKVCSQNSGYDAEVYVYDAKTQQELLNTETFTKKFPMLNSGLTNLRVEVNPLSLYLDTKDGRNVVYFIDKDTLFANSSDANKYINSSEEIYSDFGLGKDDQGNSRMKVFYGTGTLYDVKNGMNTFIHSSKMITKNHRLEITDILPDKIFIEAVKLFSNRECCLIFHQDVAGDNSNRLLSCVNSDGKIFWTKKQEELFDGLEGRKDRSFSSMFFLKSHVSALKSGNLVIFKFDDGGLIGFDYATGKEMWRVKI